MDLIFLDDIIVLRTLNFWIFDLWSVDQQQIFWWQTLWFNTCIAILSFFFSSLLFCIVGSCWRPASTGNLVIAKVIDNTKFWTLWVATIKSQMAVGHWEEKSIQGLFIREKKWWHPRCNVFSQPYSGHGECCTFTRIKVKRNTMHKPMSLLSVFSRLTIHFFGTCHWIWKIFVFV